MSKRIGKDEIDRFHDYGIYLPQRVIYMGSENVEMDGESGTDSRMAERVVKNILVLDSLGNEPIDIIMNNPGGEVIHGMAIFDVIKGCSSPVAIRVFGQASSMGSIILQAADERFVAPNAKIMIHYGSFSIDDHMKTAEKAMEEEKKYNLWMEQLYLSKIREKKPKFTLGKLRKMLSFDTTLSAEEALELGLVDGVLGRSTEE